MRLLTTWVLLLLSISIAPAADSMYGTIEGWGQMVDPDGEDVFRYVIRVNVGGSGKTVDDSDLQILASLQSLESLSIENAQLSVFGADSLCKLRSLKFLTISDSVVAEGTFERLKRCPALRELTLRGVPLSRNLLEELASLHSVRVHLSLTSTL